MKAEVGIDAQKQARYDVLSRNIGILDSALHRLEEEIKHVEGADARRAQAVQDRRHAYAQVFATLVEEEAILVALYGPLSTQIDASHGAVTKIALVVEREIDLASWVSAGEALLDLRSATQFRRGALAELAEKHLLTAWRTGAAEAVATAMSAFVEQIQQDVKRARPPSVEDRAAWGREVARWLYSTSHVRIQYAITYDGTRIEQLSPGTRGIVLLLLYLVLDRQDERPLLIDQPEENLDPKSVFDELVPHFREARKRRQVIMVTHNANLVVNTDADQIFVASAKHDGAGGLPSITYAVGTLENPRPAKLCARRLRVASERSWNAPSATVCNGSTGVAAAIADARCPDKEPVKRPLHGTLGGPPPGSSPPRTSSKPTTSELTQICTHLRPDEDSPCCQALRLHPAEGASVRR